LPREWHGPIEREREREREREGGSEEVQRVGGVPKVLLLLLMLLGQPNQTAPHHVYGTPRRSNAIWPNSLPRGRGGIVVGSNHDAA
jgi:hypothetical protein